MSTGKFIYIRGYNPQDCIAAANAIRVNGEPVDSIISFDDFAIKAKKLLGFGGRWDDFELVEHQIFARLIVDSNITTVIYTSLNQTSYDIELPNWRDSYSIASFWITNDAYIHLWNPSAIFDISFITTELTITDPLPDGHIWASETFATSKFSVLGSRHLFETKSETIGLHVIKPKRPLSILIPTAELSTLGYQYHPKYFRWSRISTLPSITELKGL